MDATESNGVQRQLDGTFAPGTKGGPGNPHARRSYEFRELLYKTITAQEFKGVLAILVQEALAGKRWAVCEFLDRVLGKSRQSVDVEGLPELLKETIELVRKPVPNDGN